MIVNIETTFKCDYETIVKNLNNSATHKYITSPLMTFTPTNANEYDGDWINGKVEVSMKLFGLIPFGKQVFGIERIQEDDNDEYIIRDNGHGEMVSKWDHWVFIRRTNKVNKTIYIDRLEIKAGFLTFFVWIFANIFYRWRQFRWKKLINKSFQQLENYSA